MSLGVPLNAGAGNLIFSGTKFPASAAQERISAVKKQRNKTNPISLTKSFLDIFIFFIVCCILGLIANRDKPDSRPIRHGSDRHACRDPIIG